MYPALLKAIKKLKTTAGYTSWNGERRKMYDEMYSTLFKWFST